MASAEKNSGTLRLPTILARRAHLTQNPKQMPAHLRIFRAECGIDGHTRIGDGMSEHANQSIQPGWLASR
jgi:hypothetical protein